MIRIMLEGLGLGLLLVLVCAFGIRKGAVGMVHLYDSAVQARCVELGLTSADRIRRNSAVFKAVCVPGYMAYVLVCVYVMNDAHGFVSGFWQLFAILSVMNLVDRFLIDDFWVGRVPADVRFGGGKAWRQKDWALRLLRMGRRRVDAQLGRDLQKCRSGPCG